MAAQNGEEQHYQIVDGECRFRATEGILEELPCIVLTEETARFWSLKANLLREDLNPMEKSDCLMRYMKVANLLNQEGKAERNSITMISGKYNISTSMVSELYSLQRLPDHIKEEQRKTGYIPLRKFKTLSTKKILADDELLADRYQQLIKQFAPKEPKKIEKRDPSQPNKITLKRIEGVRSKAEHTLEYYKQLDFSTYSVEESSELKKSLDDALLSIMELQEVIDQKIKALNTKLALNEN